MRLGFLAPVLLPGLFLAQQGTIEGRVTAAGQLPPVAVVSVVGLGHTTPASAPEAAYHSKLARAEPAVDSTVQASPSRVRLWFTENCEVSLSTIKLLDVAGAEVALGKATATDDPRSIAAAVYAKLAPGSYKVVYKTAGKDGHAVRGEYSFRVAK